MTTDSDFLARYHAALASGRLRADPAQAAAVAGMDAVYRAMILSTQVGKGWFARKSSVSGPAGLYLWGDVGRGKSMLMDMFVEALHAKRPTRRVHFHAFMRDVHARLHAMRQLGVEDLLPRVVKELAREVSVLVLDEMQVSDVTDAMILARLFTGLMDAGVAVFFTSNRAPRDLYQGGLQREQFLVFVDLLEARLPILELASPTDYRYAQLQSMQRTYHWPLDTVSEDFLLATWGALTGGAASVPLRIRVQGRVLEVEKHVHGIAWLTFDELCARPLGAGDYLELATLCHTLVLQGIPALSPELRNEAKRFVTLIDALYEYRVKLIATAATAPEDIYPAGDGNFEFHRTVSRLMEMQSATYLALPHGVGQGVGV